MENECFVQDKMWSLLTYTYKYYPLFRILSTLFTYIIATYSDIINILDALKMINLFFKGYNPCGEMYFSRNIYYKFLLIII